MLNSLLSAEIRNSQELQSAVVRLSIWAFMLAMLGIAADETAGHVLVAEDDDINAKLIASLLRKSGCKVSVARDGLAALEATAEAAFDLAFIDLRTPRMDGIDFTRSFRARERPDTHLPITALTANAA